MRGGPGGAGGLDEVYQPDRKVRLVFLKEVTRVSHITWRRKDSLQRWQHTQKPLGK